MFKPRIGVLGRDAREWYAAVDLAAGGFDVTYAGPLPVRGVRANLPPRVFKDAATVALGRHVLLGPVRAWQPEGEDGLVAAVSALTPGSLVIMGNPGAKVRQAVVEQGHQLVNLLERDDFALRNAVPTAEGALVEAIQAADVSLADSKTLVIGYGRTGQVLAHRLHGLAAQVTVLARCAGQRAAALAAGLKAAPLSQLTDYAPTADFIFNTVPALVITASVLKVCRQSLVIVDIASEPGGVDRDQAERRGIVCRWPLGIPGRVQPRTAGRIVHDVVHTILAEAGRPPWANMLTSTAVREAGA